MFDLFGKEAKRRRLKRMYIKLMQEAYRAEQKDKSLCEQKKKEALQLIKKIREL